jgi:hypothetical protein
MKILFDCLNSDSISCPVTFGVFICMFDVMTWGSVALCRRVIEMTQEAVSAKMIKRYNNYPRNIEVVLIIDIHRSLHPLGIKKSTF